ncbi:MAG: hypothetical protein HZB18_01530 [Chloroflexi bacterium]|nr:hypothetical protein [Chloroflexota bacterium]
MKTSPIPTIVLLFIILVSLLAFANFNQPAVSAQSTAGLALQTTPTPPVDDTSVIGSTDGILIMGIVIVLIITLPLLFRKKRK